MKESVRKFITRRGIIASSICVVATLLSATADARSRKRAAPKSDIVVVHPRSFTDSGTVVPVGSMNAYMQQMTRYNRQPLQQYSPGLLWRPRVYSVP